MMWQTCSRREAEAWGVSVAGTSLCQQMYVGDKTMGEGEWAPFEYAGDGWKGCYGHADDVDVPVRQRHQDPLGQPVGWFNFRDTS